MPTTALHEPISLGPITITFSVTADQSSDSITLQRCDVKAGHGVPMLHSHDGFEETIYGLEGVITFTVDGEEVEIGPGDTLCIRRGQVHSFMAHGEDASILAAATPGVLGPSYFLELRDVIMAAAGGPPEPAAMAAVMRRHGLSPVI